MGQSSHPSFHDTEARDSGTFDGQDLQPWNKPLSEILLRDFQELHDAVESAPLLARMREGKLPDYLEYLVNIHNDLSAIEQHLRERRADSRLRDLDIEPLYRSSALEQDIAAFERNHPGLDHPEPPHTSQYHRAYFDVMAHHAPYLLVAHAAIWQLGFLFGGQQLGQEMRDRWGDRVTYRTFEFAQEPQELIQAAMSALDEFHGKLTELERARFYNEIITAWEFAGDLLGINIRPLSIRFRPMMTMAAAGVARA